MGGFNNPTNQDPFTSTFDTLAGLIALVADKDGAAKTITQLKQATADHKAAEKTAIAAKVAADSSVAAAKTIAEANAKERSELDSQRAQLESERSQLETSRSRHADAVALLETRSKNSDAQIAAMQKEALDNRNAAIANSAKAASDRAAAEQLRQEAESLRDKLKKAAVAMGIV